MPTEETSLKPGDLVRFNHRFEIIRPEIENQTGRIVKFFESSRVNIKFFILVRFPTLSLNCALDELTFIVDDDDEEYNYGY